VHVGGPPVRPRSPPIRCKGLIFLISLKIAMENGRNPPFSRLCPGPNRP
jgi:hypothetical protein